MEETFFPLLFHLTFAGVVLASLAARAVLCEWQLLLEAEHFENGVALGTG